MLFAVVKWNTWSKSITLIGGFRPSSSWQNLSNGMQHFRFDGWRDSSVSSSFFPHHPSSMSFYDEFQEKATLPDVILIRQVRFIGRDWLHSALHTWPSKCLNHLANLYFYSSVYFKRAIFWHQDLHMRTSLKVREEYIIIIDLATTIALVIRGKIESLLDMLCGQAWSIRNWKE